MKYEYVVSELPIDIYNLYAYIFINNSKGNNP